MSRGTVGHIVNNQYHKIHKNKCYNIEKYNIFISQGY